MTFDESVNCSMRLLAGDPRTVFVGQSVAYDGATIYDSLEGVPMARRIEMPVIEDFQMGYCIGMAMMGKIPVSIYPRMDFLVLALNQLLNHLDKLPLWGWDVRMIVRTRVGSKWPMNAGPQHTQNYTDALRKMTTTVVVIEVNTADEVLRTYERVLASPALSTVVIVENPR